MVGVIWALIVSAPVVIERPASEQGWNLVAHVGAGQISSDWSTLIQPSISYLGAQNSVQLTLPLIWGYDDNIATRRFRFREEDPLQWAMLLQDAQLETHDGRLRMRAGWTRPQSLGLGILVRDYIGRFDPIRPKASIEGRYHGDSTRFSAMVDSAVQTRVVGLHASWAPLHQIGIDASKRLEVHLETAQDVQSQWGWNGQQHGTAASLMLFALRDDTTSLGLFASGSQWGPTLGGYLGARAEFATRGYRGLRGVRIDVAAISSGEGYQPSAFDHRYILDPSRDRRPGWGFQTHLALHLDAFRTGLTWTQRTFDSPGRLFAQLRWETESFSIDGKYSFARDAQGERTADEVTVASIELSTMLHDGLFAFTRAYRGPVVGSDPFEFQWLVGFGYGGSQGGS